MIDRIMDQETAKKILQAGLGKAELELVTSYTTAIFWPRVMDGAVRIANGSVFFLDAGKGPIAVTSAHVLEGWRQDRKNQTAAPIRLAGAASLVIDVEDRLIDEDTKIDIATFRIDATEVGFLGKVILTGAQKSWPPIPPQLECGVLLSGYAGRGTVILKADEVSFGAVPAGLIAHSISELDVSCMLDRNELIGAMGGGIPPENFDFGGISGGPMLTIVEQNGVRTHVLAGVIYQGPNTSSDENEAIGGLEIIRARRAHFIKANGELDRERWGAANIR